MKRILLLFIFSVVGIGIACADEPIKGIIVTYDGAETSYKLEEIPTVKYEMVGSVNHAVLYLKDKAEPVLSVALAKGKSLKVIYGEYIPSAIYDVNASKAVIIEKEGKKYIHGGKLIIIGKDNQYYNVKGEKIQ